MNDSTPLSPEAFDALLVAIQPRLRSYIAALLGGWSAVDDITQDVTMVLIQKRETFQPNSNFVAWAFKVAYFKATTWRRDLQREGRVMLSETFFQSAAAIAESHLTEKSDIHLALDDCLAKLPAHDQELVHLKYIEKVSLTSHAALSGRKVNALHQSISRIRLALRECIRRQLSNPSPTHRGLP